MPSVRWPSSRHPRTAPRATCRLRYPLGADTRIEGGRSSGGDRHAIIVNKRTCRLYETFATRRASSGKWHAGSGASWILTNNKLRPQGWTSADAAGLPFPISSYRADTQTVLRAMKRFGLVLADNGSPWFFQGARSSHWQSGLLDQLKSIPASAFVAVDTSSLRVSANSARVG